MGSARRKQKKRARSKRKKRKKEFYFYFCLLISFWFTLLFDFILLFLRNLVVFVFGGRKQRGDILVLLFLNVLYIFYFHITT